MRRNTIFWGTILVAGGILALLYNLGIITINIWTLIWPLFLIALGVWILWGNVFFRRSRVEAEQVTIPAEGASRARIRIHHGAGRLWMRGGAGDGYLVNGTFAGGLDYRTKRNGDALDVDMRISEQFFFVWGGVTPLDWDFQLNNSLPLSLDLNTGAGETNADLSDLKVDDLRLQTGASASQVTLPAAAGFTHARVEAGVASVNLRIPAGVAARIRVRSGLAGITVDQTRFPRVGDFYMSPDYDTSANKIDVDIQTGVGSVDIR